MSPHPRSADDITDPARSSPLSFENAALSSGVDSGYSSAAVTPKSLDRVLDPSKFDSTRIPNPIRLFYPRKGTNDLKPFEKDVEKATMDRYEDVRVRLEVALAKYMQSSPRNYKPMAIRLVVLGTTEEDAKAWIVVFCPDHRVKRVQRFFDKQLARDLCQPQDPDIPSFQVTIVGQPPQTKAGSAIEVCSNVTDSEATYTLCGTLIKLSDGNQTRIGTLGGIIKVINDAGLLTFYGMTAGHLTEGMANSANIDIEESYDSADDRSDWTSSDECDNLSDLPESATSRGEPQVRRNGKQLLDAFASTAQPGMESVDNWNCIGNLLTTSTITNRDAPSAQGLLNRDWALIELKNEDDLKPNRLRGAEGAQKNLFDDLKVRSKEHSKITAPLRVVMDSGLQGVKRGTLSPLPCSVLLGSGRRFVQAYVLKLWDGAGIRQGDSGSWVIDSTTLEVYGHVTASDIFGDAYVIPIQEILADMKDQLNAASVELLSSVDIAFIRLRNQPSYPSTPTKARADLRPPVTPPLPVQPDALVPEDYCKSGDSGYSSAYTSPVPLPFAAGLRATIGPQTQHDMVGSPAVHDGIPPPPPSGGTILWACCSCSRHNTLPPTPNICVCGHLLCNTCNWHSYARGVASEGSKRVAPSISLSEMVRAAKRFKIDIEEQ